MGNWWEELNDATPTVAPAAAVAEPGNSQGNWWEQLNDVTPPQGMADSLAARSQAPVPGMADSFAARTGYAVSDAPNYAGSWEQHYDQLLADQTNPESIQRLGDLRAGDIANREAGIGPARPLPPGATPGQQIAYYTEMYAAPPTAAEPTIGSRLSDAKNYVAGKTPFMGSVIRGVQIADVILSANRIRSGQYTQDDIIKIASYLGENKQKENWSALRTAFEVLADIPGFAAEIGATGGAFTAGREAAERLIGEKASKKIAGKAVASAVGLGAMTAANPQRVAEGALQRTADTFETVVGPDGRPVEINVGDPKNLIAQLPAAFVDQAIELGTEMAGDALGKGAKAVAKNIPYAKKLIAARKYIIDRWLAKPGRTVGMLQRMIDAGHWNGIAGEILEERAGDVARMATGLQSPYDNPTGQLLVAAPYEAIAGDPEKAKALQRQAFSQLAVEGLAFGAMGGITGAANLAARGLDRMAQGQQPPGAPPTPPPGSPPTRPAFDVNTAEQWAATNPDAAAAMAAHVDKKRPVSRGYLEKIGVPNSGGSTTEERNQFAARVQAYLQAQQNGQQQGPPPPPPAAPTAPQDDIRESQFQAMKQEEINRVEEHLKHLEATGAEESVKDMLRKDLEELKSGAHDDYFRKKLDEYWQGGGQSQVNPPLPTETQVNPPLPEQQQTPSTTGLREAGGDMARGAIDAMYDGIRESIAKTGDVPGPEKRSNVGVLWQVAKANNVSGDDFVDALRKAQPSTPEEWNQLAQSFAKPGKGVIQNEGSTETTQTTSQAPEGQQGGQKGVLTPETSQQPASTPAAGSTQPRERPKRLNGAPVKFVKEKVSSDNILTELYTGPNNSALVRMVDLESGKEARVVHYTTREVAEEEYEASENFPRILLRRSSESKGSNETQAPAAGGVQKDGKYQVYTGSGNKKHTNYAQSYPQLPHLVAGDKQGVRIDRVHGADRSMPIVTRNMYDETSHRELSAVDEHSLYPAGEKPDPSVSPFDRAKKSSWTLEELDKFVDGKLADPNTSSVDLRKYREVKQWISNENNRKWYRENVNNGQAKPAAATTTATESTDKPTEETGKKKLGKPEKQYKTVGKNAQGEDIQEDEKGVRSIVRGNVRSVEKVQITPTRAGVESSVDLSRRSSEYKTLDERIDEHLQEARDWHKDQTIKTTTAQTDAEQRVERAANKLGRRVVWLTSEDPNWSSTGFAFQKSLPEVVFLRSGMEGFKAGEDGLWGVFGHELAHATGFDRESFSKELIDEMAEKRIARSRNEDYKKKMQEDPELRYREAVAQFVQDFMSDEQMRARVFRDDPSLFAKIRQFILDLVAKIGDDVLTPAQRKVLDWLREAQAPKKLSAKTATAADLKAGLKEKMREARERQQQQQQQPKAEEPAKEEPAAEPPAPQENKRKGAGDGGIFEGADFSAIPAGTMVEAKAISAAGDLVDAKLDAREALQGYYDDLKKYEQLLECLAL